ncbi:hypothetical protein ACFFHM_07950 [Halalkalibacter kiskunsagensis]|uniref:Uncharacterized protein n=1 Tax=Halalkalibacter kiskunsagensis TaxID=1548599 RepID=A0ABV6KAW4_9BACI
MQNEYEIQLKEQICDIGIRLYMREMGAANDGNITVKLSNDSLLCFNQAG